MSANPHEFARKPLVRLTLWIQNGEFESDRDLFADTVAEALQQRRDKFPNMPAGELLVDNHHYRTLRVGKE